MGIGLVAQKMGKPVFDARELCQQGARGLFGEFDESRGIEVGFSIVDTQHKGRLAVVSEKVAHDERAGAVILMWFN